MTDVLNLSTPEGRRSYAEQLIGARPAALAAWLHEAKVSLIARALDAAFEAGRQTGREERPEAPVPLCPACVDAMPLGGVDFPWRRAKLGELCGAADHESAYASSPGGSHDRQDP